MKNDPKTVQDLIELIDSFPIHNLPYYHPEIYEKGMENAAELLAPFKDRILVKPDRCPTCKHRASRATSASCDVCDIYDHFEPKENENEK